MLPIKNLTISKARKLLLDKEISSVELTKTFFDQIEKKDSSINAYLSLREDKALKEAEGIDKKIKNNEEIGPLGGIPLAVKDNILIKGETTTSASKILENYQASYNATVINKIKEAGAVILGKTNLDEFAMGSSTETSAFKTTLNPLDKTRTPGGSSGGSAAAVASDQALVALGSDTAGSIRQPASFCGLVGMKPSYGSVSRSGLTALTSSLDQIGPLAKTTEDAAILFNTIKGEDPYDQTSRNIQFDLKNILENPLDFKNLKVGIIKECFEQKIDSDLDETFKESLNLIQSLKGEIKEVSLPLLSAVLPVYYIITPSEVSSNLSRLDGLRYASDKNLKGSLQDLYISHRGEKFGPEVKRRISLGTFALSAGYYDAYYKKAKKVQLLLKKKFEEIFKEVDIIVLPTAPTPAFKIGEKMNPLDMYLSDIFTAPANVADLTAISLPVYGKNPLPYGFQIMAPSKGEEIMMRSALAFEKAYENIRNNN